jgi:iron complex outermembrane receptor protein
MTRTATRAGLLSSSILTGLALASAWAGAAAAQSAGGQPPAAAPSVSEVVVTGSLIRRTGVETPSPVTVLTADSLAKSGITTIADALRTISADSSGTIPTAFSNGFAAGSSAIALRGLTVNSTLTLIDGLRTANYPLPDDGVRGFVDLNTIPFSAVERVEVLKDGASSIYGADAIGGVVNVIMKKTYEGEEGDWEVGGTQHGGGFNQRFTATVGHGDLDTDHYNVYLDAEYQHDDRILDAERGFPFNTQNLTSIGGQNQIGGQPGFNNGSIYGTVAPATLAGGNVLDATTIGVFQPLRSCGASTTKSTDGAGDVYCAQNFLRYTDIQPVETRSGVLGRFTAQLNPHTQVFFTASLYENRTVTDEAPSQIQNSTPINTNLIALPARLSNGQLNPNDPFAALGEAAAINYAFGDIPSQIRLDNHLYRAVLGINGDAWGWDYQASLNANRGVLNTEGTGFIYEPQLISDVQTGAYSFINPSSNSAAVRAALAPNLYKTSTSDLDSIDFSATRKLWELPGGPLSFGFGGQFRYEAVHNPNINTNDEVAAGDGTIQPAFTFGHRTVGGIFAEAEAPIFKPLVINISGRYDHYSDVGGNFSPKVGVKFTPIRQIALRGTYSEGFRAPSFSESGDSGVIGYTPYTVLGNAPQSYINAHSPGGVPDAYVTNAYNLNGSTIGNPLIKPETSRSYTLGAVFEPDRHFNISVDYYHISKKNVIGGPNQGAILADYYAGKPLPQGVSVIADAPDPLAPNALARPIVIDETYVNTNSESTDGLDIDLRSKFDLPYGVVWTSDLNFTDIFSFTYDNNGQVEQYVGSQAPYALSSGAGTPKYRANWVNSFTYGRLNVTGTLYYISPIKETGVDVTGSSSACLYSTPSGAPFPADCTVGAFWDLDLTGRYKVNEHFEVYAYVANLLDAKAPLDPADYAAGAVPVPGMNYNPTYAQAGAVGRAFKIGFHVKY